MPTYEYVCKSCGHAWEAQQRISEAPLTECPTCHQATAQRQISGGNFILKGGGWYADLYSSSSSSKKSEGSASEKPATDKPSSDKPKSEAPKADNSSSSPSSTTSTTTTTPKAKG